MDKRGFSMPEAILDFIAFIALMLIIALVGIIISAGQILNQSEVSEAAFENQNNQMILNLLKTPVETEIKLGDKGNEKIQMEILSILSLWFDDDRYKGLLEDSISGILNSFYGADILWRMEVGEKALSNGGRITQIVARQLLFEETVLAPLTFNEDILKVDIRLKIYVNQVEEGSICFFPSTPLKRRYRCEVDGTRICECIFYGKSLRWAGCKDCPDRCDADNDVCA